MYIYYSPAPPMPNASKGAGHRVQPLVVYIFYLSIYLYLYLSVYLSISIYLSIYVYILLTSAPYA